MSKSIPVFEPPGELAPGLLRDVLGLVSLEVAVGVIAAWSPSEQKLAYDYAMREHMLASDNHSVRSRPLPWFIAMSVVASAPGAVIVIPGELSHLFRQAQEDGK